MRDDNSANEVRVIGTCTTQWPAWGLDIVEEWSKKAMARIIGVPDDDKGQNGILAIGG
jgi:hypothetical protein